MVLYPACDNQRCRPKLCIFIWMFLCLPLHRPTSWSLKWINKIYFCWFEPHAASYYPFNQPKANVGSSTSTYNSGGVVVKMPSGQIIYESYRKGEDDGFEPLHLHRTLCILFISRFNRNASRFRQVIPERCTSNNNRTSISCRVLNPFQGSSAVNVSRLGWKIVGWWTGHHPEDNRFQLR